MKKSIMEQILEKCSKIYKEQDEEKDVDKNTEEEEKKEDVKEEKECQCEAFYGTNY